MTVLLDTHVLLYWLGADPRLSAAQPADQIIIASAQVLGGTLLTRDRRIIDAALVPTLA